jgi:hypothetical protein
VITVTKIGAERHEIVIDTRSPLIYLDHWALRRLSEDSTRRALFLAAFQRHGTLMFSLMNVAEIAGDPEETRSAQIRDFLEQVGAHWVPMTIDALRVMEAEDTGKTPDGAHPCVSPAFLTDGHFFERITQGTPTLAHVVDLTRGSNGTEIRVGTEADTARLHAHIQDWRDARKADKRALDKQLNARFPKKVFDPAKPMRYIYHGLARLTITDGFTLDDNHMHDLYYACAAVRCAEMVTLDGHWTEQVRKLNLPADFVSVYSERELDQFLSDLERWPTTTPQEGGLIKNPA